VFKKLIWILVLPLISVNFNSTNYFYLDQKDEPIKRLSCNLCFCLFTGKMWKK